MGYRWESGTNRLRCFVVLSLVITLSPVPAPAIDCDSWQYITVAADCRDDPGPWFWTGSLAISWLHRYDPATNTCTPTSSAGRPSTPAGTHTLAGQYLIIWGGQSGSGGVGTGSRYHIATDSWTAMGTAGAPSIRYSHAAVWTGTRVFIWGGRDAQGLLGNGGLYDPSSNTWTDVGTTPVISARHSHLAVMAQGRVIIWGGMTASGPTNTGARYDPMTGLWQASSVASAPDVQYVNDTVMLAAGPKVIVTGGWFEVVQVGRNYRPVSHVYDPSSDSWETVSPALSDGHGFSAVWNGTDAVFLGGEDCFWYDEVDRYGDHYIYLLCYTEAPWNGSRYNPATGSVTNILWPGGPRARARHTALWIGDRFYLWGGIEAQYYSLGSTTYGYAEYAGIGEFTYRPGPDQVQSDADNDGQTVCTGDCDDTDSTVRSGGPQICGDGLNNDCLAPGWPSLAGTNEADDDGDGFSECQLDCDDGNASIWMVSSQATSLTLNLDIGTGITSLTWTAPAQPGATHVVYDVMRALNTPDFIYWNTVCVESNDGSNTAASESATPAAGAGFFYLVRAENACNRPSPAGFNSAGEWIPASPCPYP